VTQQKLSEKEARHVFRQLFDGLKYLVSISIMCCGNKLINYH
jgi:hypothetical protein